MKNLVTGATGLVENSVVFVRLEYFWKKLDFWTFASVSPD